MITHELKCWPKQFEAIRKGRKTFEFRYDDRDFGETDMLLLREYDPETATYSGNRLRMQVSYIMYGPAFGLPEGYVVMSIVRPGAMPGGPF